MGTNGFGSEDEFDASRDEAIPLLLGMASASKENIPFYGSNSLAPHQGSNTSGSDPNGRLVHHSLVISMKNTNALNPFSRQSAIRAILNAGVCDAPDDKQCTAKPSNGNCITTCVGSNEISRDQNTPTGSLGLSALTNSFAALQHSNSSPFAQAEEVISLYPSVNKSQSSTRTAGEKRVVRGVPRQSLRRRELIGRIYRKVPSILVPHLSLPLPQRTVENDPLGPGSQKSPSARRRSGLPEY
ncbi:unnamed protein product [Tuber aestivum]|uniref:Uncharacterized protein n=1 Tax=Tuber aestivum TaxID=59557 RepID=A0A292PS06_9PEZI|nr:unnamed protein product [Tuber aestivum]